MSFDVLQFFKDFNISYSTETNNSSSGWVNTRCVFCDDTSDHLGWSFMGYTHCWRCGGHNLISAIEKLLGVSYFQAEEISFEYDTSYATTIRLNKKRKLAQASHIKLPGSDLTKFHKKYLRKRGFDPDFICKKYGVKGTGPKEKWNGYDFELSLIIPIYYRRQLVSFQARDITGQKKVRYKACPIKESVVSIKDILYNLDNCSQDRIFVVEGITDVWKLGDSFACSFGTSMGESQLKKLISFEKIFFLFDPEKEAQEKAKRYAEKLSSIGKQVEVLELNIDKDPGSFTEKEVSELKSILEV